MQQGRFSRIAHFVICLVLLLPVCFNCSFFSEHWFRHEITWYDAKGTYVLSVWQMQKACVEQERRTSLLCVPAATESVQDASRDIQPSSGITSPVDVGADIGDEPQGDDVRPSISHAYRVDTVSYVRGEITQLQRALRICDAAKVCAFECQLAK